MRRINSPFMGGGEHNNLIYEIYASLNSYNLRKFN